MSELDKTSTSLTRCVYIIADTDQCSCQGSGQKVYCALSVQTVYVYITLQNFTMPGEVATSLA